MLLKEIMANKISSTNVVISVFALLALASTIYYGVMWLSTPRLGDSWSLYAGDEYPDNWYKPNFDDSGWLKASLPYKYMDVNHVLGRGTIYASQGLDTKITLTADDCFSEVYVNGNLIFHGQCTIDSVNHWAGLTLDLSDYLHKGENQIAVVDQNNYGGGASFAVQSSTGSQLKNMLANSLLLALVTIVLVYQGKHKFETLKGGNVKHNVLLFTLICLLAYSIVGGERTLGFSDTSHHQYFAQAYLTGQLGIKYPLEELVPGSGGLLYNQHGPMPAFLMMPAVYLLGPVISDHTFMIVLTGLSSAVFMTALFNLRRSGIELNLRSVWVYSIFFSFGTLIMTYSSIGWYWFLTQMTSVLFLTLYLLVLVRGGSPVLAASFVGASMLARYHTILFAGIFYFYLILDKEKSFREKSIRFLTFTIVLSIFISGFMLHNYLRFGSIFDTGYPSDWIGKRYFGDGYFKFNNVEPHLSNIFFGLPILTGEYPYFKISAHGLSVFLTGPLFIYLFRIRYDNPLKKAILWGTFIFFIMISGYGGDGWTQFGYRYTLEMVPPLVILLAMDDEHIRKNKLFYALLVMGILVNLFGALTYRRPGLYELFYII